MTTDNLSPTMVVFPERLKRVFHLLKCGRHLCQEDGPDYRDLSSHEDTYRPLFAALGYELVYDGQGFYFFKGDSSLSSLRLRGATLFMFILFQDLEDKKLQTTERAWERQLLKRPFKITELPHFMTSKRRNMLRSVDVEPETLFKKVLRPMARMGMLEILDSERFQFRAPVYRFVDLCIQFADKQLPTNPEQMPAPLPIPENGDMRGDDSGDLNEEMA
jgi:hypothetical protein